MKKILLILLVFASATFTVPTLAAISVPHSVDSIFSSFGEIYLKFELKNKAEIGQFTRIISIDRVDGLTVYAYTDLTGFKEFSKLKTNYEILQNPGTLADPESLGSPAASLNRNERTQWNFYPTYQQYLDFMTAFATDYPGLCRLDTVGVSTQGRLILAVKISDNVDQDEPEPQFLYTSTIHGDETAGYVLMLHLIDHLLLNYGTVPEITDLVNSTEIFINPLANPDGTYRGGNQSVYGAVRFNANNVDLNRNFPDPKLGQHPDGKPWQVETVAWMDYATSHRFSMSANFHGGAEVFNYPWDTWSRLAADDSWWQFVGREWADTVHQYGPPGYFTYLNNGITNGYAWYELNGGRQDYMNYWHNCREVTLEISNIKLLPVSQLLPFWEYNHRSFLNYIREANYGINGIVTDTVTDMPVEAKVFITGHDKDNSEVYSHLPHGFYARLIDEGSWDLTFSAPGYYTKTVQDVNVVKRETTRLDVQLRPLTFDMQDKTEQAMLVYPNPSTGKFRIVLPESPVHSMCSVQVLDLTGNIVHTSMLAPNCGAPFVDMNLTGLHEGLYFLRFNSGFRIYLDKLVIKK